MSAHQPYYEGDPLAKLYKQLERLRAASAKGADVGLDIQDVVRSIGEIIEGREEAARQRVRYRERE